VVTRVILAAMDSFAAAHRLAGGPASIPPLVLDFASDSEPGGGWRSGQQGTQEEGLCRRSTLGLQLEALDYPFAGSHSLAYVSECLVLKDEKGQLLPAWAFTVAVAAAALRNVGDDELDPAQKNFVRSKLQGVLSVAALGGHHAVVLGAWGCGAFGNSASSVAAVAKELLLGSAGPECTGKPSSTGSPSCAGSAVRQVRLHSASASASPLPRLVRLTLAS
jgi:uncharacterized protein (TIGR02452 family)